jgi:hypothetical protein
MNILVRKFSLRTAMPVARAFAAGDAGFKADRG